MTEPKNNNLYYHISTTYELSQSRVDSTLFEKYESVMNSIAINFLSNLSQTNLTKFNRSGKQLA
jgi:hypothetical protein